MLFFKKAVIGFNNIKSNFPQNKSSSFFVKSGFANIFYS